MTNTTLYLLIAPMAAALIFFALGAAAVISHQTGGHPRTGYWSKIFSGAGYLLLALQGVVVAPYLSGLQSLGTFCATGAFSALGIILVTWGLRLRRQNVSH